jgi:hypothetical protein
MKRVTAVSCTIPIWNRIRPPWWSPKQQLPNWHHYKVPSHHRLQQLHRKDPTQETIDLIHQKDGNRVNPTPDEEGVYNTPPHHQLYKNPMKEQHIVLHQMDIEETSTKEPLTDNVTRHTSMDSKDNNPKEITNTKDDDNNQKPTPKDSDDDQKPKWTVTMKHQHTFWIK